MYLLQETEAPHFFAVMVSRTLYRGDVGIAAKSSPKNQHSPNVVFGLELRQKREKPVHQLRVHRGTQSVPFDRGAEGVAASACYWNSSPNRSSARALHVKRPAPRDGIWLEVIVFMGFKNFVRLS